FVVEVGDPAVEVLLAEHGLTVHDKATGRKYSLKPGRQELPSGDYEIDVTEEAGGLAFSTREFRIMRGDEEGGKGTLKPSAIKVGEVRRFKGHTDRITSIDFSPGGHLAASTSLDKTVRVWDVKTGEQIRLIEGHTAPVSQARFTPD